MPRYFTDELLRRLRNDCEVKKLDLFHRFSRGLHYPRTVMFATDLPCGRHVLKLKMAEEKNEGSSGHAMRILQFAVNRVSLL